MKCECKCKCGCMDNQSIRRLKSQLTPIERVLTIKQVKVDTSSEEYQRVQEMWKDRDETSREAKH